MFEDGYAQGLLKVCGYKDNAELNAEKIARIIMTMPAEVRQQYGEEMENILNQEYARQQD